MRALPKVFAMLHAAALLMLSVAAPARAADAPSTMFVIDGSGSMWGPLLPDKVAKIDQVRNVLTPLLAASPNARIGVTSYGHRRRGDCRDAETLAGIAAPHDAAVDAVAKLDPRGKGPLVAGLAAAMADVGATRPASLIVITDGADNCQQDACAAAAGFASTAPGVAIHMITLGVDPADATRLACIAKATGGSLFEANDPAALAAAIDAAAKLAMLNPGAPSTATPNSPSAPSPAATGPATLHATLALSEGSEALNVPAHWRIFPSGGTIALAESDGPDVTMRLDPGAFDIEARVGQMRARKSITLDAGGRHDIAVAMNAGRLIVSAANAKGATRSPRAVIAITADGATPAVGPAATVMHGGGADVILTPGVYKVAVTDNIAAKTQSVAIDAGATTKLDVVLDAGRLDLTTVGADGAALGDVAYTISEDDPESADGRRDVARSRAPQASFALPAGTYYVEAASGAGVVRERVAVGAGEAVVRALPLPLVPVTITAEIAGARAKPGQGVVYRITALDGDQREIARSLQPTVETLLAPGRYRIAAHLDAHHITTERDVTIVAGNPVSVVIDIAAGEILLKGPADAGDVYWEIANAEGKPVWRTQLGEPKALLAPGRYTVRYEHRDKRLEAAFEVKSGERRTLEMGAVSP